MCSSRYICWKLNSWCHSVEKWSFKGWSSHKDRTWLKPLLKKWVSFCGSGFMIKRWVVPLFFALVCSAMQMDGPPCGIRTPILRRVSMQKGGNGQNERLVTYKEIGQIRKSLQYNGGQFPDCWRITNMERENYNGSHSMGLTLKVLLWTHDLVIV